MTAACSRRIRRRASSRRAFQLISPIVSERIQRLRSSPHCAGGSPSNCRGCQDAWAGCASHNSPLLPQGRKARQLFPNIDGQFEQGGVVVRPVFVGVRRCCRNGGKAVHRGQIMLAARGYLAAFHAPAKTILSCAKGRSLTLIFYFVTGCLPAWFHACPHPRTPANMRAVRHACLHPCIPA